jgi:hypothetical protein
MRDSACWPSLVRVAKESHKVALGVFRRLGVWDRFKVGNLPGVIHPGQKGLPGACRKAPPRENGQPRFARRSVSMNNSNPELNFLLLEMLSCFQ